MLVGVGVVQKAVLKAQGELVVVVMRRLRAVMELQILVAALEVLAVGLLEVLAVLVSSLFDTLTHLQPQHQQLAHQQLQCLAVIVSTHLQVQGVSHSDGTLCKTQ
jgi:hypothetical protein